MTPHLRRHALLLLAALALPAGALVGDWRAYTHLDSVHCLLDHQGSLWAGTGGGLRRIDPATGTEQTWNNPARGMLDVDISALAATPAGELWASSRAGYLYRLRPDGDWETFDRGFSADQWKFNRNALLAARQLLLLGSTRGLSFFNTQTGLVELNVDRFGTGGNLSVNSLLRVDSSLCLGTSAGVFRATVWWNSPLHPPASFLAAHRSLTDPLIWEKLDSLSSPALDSTESYGLLALEGDGLRVYAGGTIRPEGAGVRAIPGFPLEANGTVFAGDLDMTSAAVVAGKVFAGGPRGCFAVEGDNLRRLAAPFALPPGVAANIHSSPAGTYLWSIQTEIGSSQVYRLHPGGWEALPGLAIPQYFETFTNRLRLLFAADPNDLWVPNWGFGVWHYNSGSLRVYDTSTCLEGVPASPAFTPIQAAVPFGREGLFVSVYHVASPSQLAFIDFTSGVVNCFPYHFLPGNPKVVQRMEVIGDSLLLLSTELGAELYWVGNPRMTDGLAFRKRVRSPDLLDAQVYATAVDAQGRLWATTYTGIHSEDGFLTKPDNTDTLKPLDGLSIGACRSIEADGAGDLWFGCDNGVFQVQPGTTTPVQSFRHYGNRDGLLADEVYELQVDPSTGEVWIATAKGVSVLEGPGRTLSPGTTRPAIRAYPNPFLPPHEFVVFDELPPGARVQVQNQGGTVVFRAAPADLQGWQVRWDGSNESGRRVSPGVYTWTVTAGSRTARGHLIVAR